MIHVMLSKITLWCQELFGDIYVCVIALLFFGDC